MEILQNWIFNSGNLFVMEKFIIFLDRVINLYMYYIIFACLLLLVPNINVNYPLFHYIFLSAGFYIVPPVFGIIIAPSIMLVIVALISVGLKKIYVKYYADKEPKILVLTKEDFDKLNNENGEENKDDSN